MRPTRVFSSSLLSVAAAAALLLAGCASAPAGSDPDTAASTAASVTGESSSPASETPSGETPSSDTASSEPSGGTTAAESTAGDTAAAAFPVTVTSCGFSSTLDRAPQHAVTLNQGATEVALALGVESQMAGTAYLDDAIPDKWKAAYDSVPVLSDEYPDREALLAAEPDFLYASYASAFDDKVAGTQPELAEDGIASYVSPFGCPAGQGRAETSFESVWAEVDAVAQAFGVPDRAAAFRTEQQQQLDTLDGQAAAHGHTIFWYDSGDKTPFVGAGEGGPQLVIDAIGGTNVFADLPGGWADASWEQVLKADPDVIVLADASWDTAATKKAYLESDPVLKDLSAVKAGNIVTVPFSESTPGVRLVDGAVSVADQISALGLS